MRTCWSWRGSTDIHASGDRQPRTVSGFLSITLREPDRTEHRLLGWNTVAPSFMRAGIPEGDPGAIAHVLGSWTRMRADFEESGPDGPFRYHNTDWFAPPGLLAPEEYGLLVVDLAEGVILDGQEGHPLDKVPLYRAFGDLEESDDTFTCQVDSDTQRFFDLYQAGRVGRLYLPTAGSMVDLPPGEPEKTLRFLAASRKLLSLETHLRAWFTIDISPLRLERFGYRNRKEMRRMRRRIRELGFTLSAAERRRWDEYLAR
jgi:hypothetical protein